MHEAKDRHIIVYLLWLRLKMAGRFLAELGRVRSVFIFLWALALYLPLLWQQAHEVAAAVTSCGLILIAGIHYRRGDRFFIKKLDITAPLFFSFEYLALALPFIFLLIAYGAWFWLSGLIAGCFVTVLLPAHAGKTASGGTAFQFPVWLPYEWTAGLRKQKWTLSFLVLASIAATVLNLYAGWVFLFLVTAAVLSFYHYCEPVSFILLSAEKPGTFLVQKIIRGIMCYSLMTAILWIEFIAFYPESATHTVLFSVANLLLFVTVIAAKYAFYHANRDIGILISSVFFTSVLFIAVPYLLPALVLLAGWLLIRAHHRLKEEVYACH